LQNPYDPMVHEMCRSHSKLFQLASCWSF
jgi:hypothetical protein